MNEIKVNLDGMKKHKELVKAWLDGAEIQIKELMGDKWYDYHDGETPLWHPDDEYRIKPELKPVPFDFDKWLVGEFVRNKETGKRYVILAQTYDYVYFIDDYIDYGQLLERYEFLSGSPCGKLEEQE